MADWDNRLMGLAKHVAGWSKDPTKKVGCVIANDKHVVSLGYNGLPAGMSDDERLLDKGFKWRYTIHAEENALLTSAEKVTGCTAYIWPTPPCPTCASKLIQAGITRVVCVDPSDRDRVKYYHHDVAEVLAESGVTLTYLKRQSWVDL